MPMSSLQNIIQGTSSPEKQQLLPLLLLLDLFLKQATLIKSCLLSKHTHTLTLLLYTHAEHFTNFKLLHSSLPFYIHPVPATIMLHTTTRTLLHRLRPSSSSTTPLLRSSSLLLPRHLATLPSPTDSIPHTHTQTFDPFNPTPEHNQLRSTLRAFVEKEVDPQALHYNRNEQFNIPLFRKLGELGLLGLTVEPEYGGSGLDAAAVAIVHEEISAADPAFCLSYLAHSLLFVNNLAQNGNATQKAKYLPAACSGEKIGGMCMSEPGAGTDVLGMSTTARKSEDGRSYVINGQKMWITNGTLDGKGTGDVFLVYAKTGKLPKEVSMFVVEKGMEGFKLGQKIGM